MMQEILNIESGTAGKFDDEEARKKAVEFKKLQMEKTAQIREKAEKVSLIIKKAGDILKDPETQEIIAKHQEITRKFKTFTDPQNERYITNIQIDATKTAIEQIFKIRDYRNVEVGGKPIFENLSIGDADRLYRKFDELSDQDLTRKYVQISCKLVADSNCSVTADSPKKFADVMEIVQQCVVNRKSMENLSAEQMTNEDNFLDSILKSNSPTYQAIVEKINQIHQEVVSTVYRTDQLKMATIETAIGHTMKHKTDFGKKTTVQEYLTKYADEMIQKNNLLGETCSQDGQYVNKFYGAHYNNHYMCAITTTIDESTFLVTMFSRLFLGSRRLK
uniref:Uncharacterized protein n=1 Tax=Panagrolaimus sp. JU765 TaxID=591449 RepID=A0AC34PVC8_9BILA